MLWLKILVSSVTKPTSCKFGVRTYKLIEDNFCVSDRCMKSHGACLIQMTLISTEHFPKRSHLLWMDTSFKRSSQQKKRRALPSSGPSNTDDQIKSTEDRVVQMHCEEFLRDTGYQTYSR